ncbi:hypothetical protein HDU81_010750 [Chytriomyces hyalinus]|nr:hypothetical protein HDU81_010750 [Chytriomyces hyalinus]
MLSQSLGQRAEAAIQQEANRLTEIYGVDHTEQCIEMARMKQKSAVHFHMAVVLAERAKRVEEAMLEDSHGMDVQEGPATRPESQSSTVGDATASAAQADSLDQRVSRTRAKWSLFITPNKPKPNESDSEAESREEAESRGIVPSLTYSHFIAQQTQARERREREKAEAHARRKLVSSDTTTDAPNPVSSNSKEADVRADCAWEQMQEELAELIANAAFDSFEDNQPPSVSATAHDASRSVFFASTAQDSQPDIPTRNSSLNRLSSYMLADLDSASYAVESPSSAKKANFIPHKIQTRLSADDLHTAFIYQSKAASTPATATVPLSETTNSTPQIISAADTIATVTSDNAINPTVTQSINPTINPLISTLPLAAHASEVKSVVALHRKASKTSATSTATSSKSLRRSNSTGAISSLKAVPSVNTPGVAHPPAQPPPVFLQPHQPYPLPYQRKQQQKQHQQQQQQQQQYSSVELDPQTQHLMAALRPQQSTPNFSFPQPQLQPIQRQIYSNPQIPSHITYSNAPTSVGRSASVMSKNSYSSTTTQQQQQHNQVVEYEVVDIGFGSTSKQGQGGTSAGDVASSGRAFTNKKPSLVSSLRKGFW